MRKLLPLFFLLTTWAACVTVEFESPQPEGIKSLKNFPKKLRGSYVNEDDGMLMIKKYSFIAGSKDSIEAGDETFLDENALLKKINRSYVLNIRGEAYWESWVVKLEKDSLFISEISAHNEIAINKLHDITEVKEVKNVEGTIEKYLIDPSKSEFLLLMKNDVFTHMFTLKKIRK